MNKDGIVYPYVPAHYNLRINEEGAKLSFARAVRQGVVARRHERHRRLYGPYHRVIEDDYWESAWRGKSVGAWLIGITMHE